MIQLQKGEGVSERRLEILWCHMVSKPASPQNGLGLYVTEQLQYHPPINGVRYDILQRVYPANNGRDQPLSFSDVAHAARLSSTLLIPITWSFIHL